MNVRNKIGTAAVVVGIGLLSSGCGGQEGRAAEEQRPKKNPIQVTATNAVQAAALQLAPQIVDAAGKLRGINRAIPVYAGAQYRDDLTRRDTVMIHSQYGPKAEVYTLATDDSYPQVYHYYTTYLAQFRGYSPQQPYPAQNQTWRTMEVHLNQAMQDPFIPGDTLTNSGRQVTLQIAETEAEPHTVIRYIVTPEAATPAVPAAR